MAEEIRVLKLGERLGAIRKLLELFQGLNINLGDILPLIKMAIDLANDFSMDKLFAFIDALNAALNKPQGLSEKPSAEEVEALLTSLVS